MKIDEKSLNSELMMGQLSAFRGPPAGYCVMREAFAYQVPVFSNLAAATGTATNQLLIQADADFEWTHGVYAFSLADAAQEWNTYDVPNMSIQIADTGSGRFMMNAAVPVPSMFGFFGNPRQLPISKVFKANSSVAFTAVNFDAAVATGQLRLTLLGWKLYYFRQSEMPEQLPQNLGA